LSFAETKAKCAGPTAILVQTYFGLMNVERRAPSGRRPSDQAKRLGL